MMIGGVARKWCRGRGRVARTAVRVTKGRHREKIAPQEDAPRSARLLLKSSRAIITKLNGTAVRGAESFGQLRPTEHAVAAAGAGLSSHRYCCRAGEPNVVRTQ